MTDKYTSAEYQNKVRSFVDREVVYCVSYLVSELAKDERHMDDLLSVCVMGDWEVAATDEGWRLEDDPDMPRYFIAINDDVDEDDRPELMATDEDEAWRELCDEQGIDPYQREAYEHWLVSDWLAGKLAERGEMIIRDFLGLTIWGRTCTGQAILLDQVICDIYDDTQKRVAA